MSQKNAHLELPPSPEVVDTMSFGNLLNCLSVIVMSNTGNQNMSVLKHYRKRKLRLLSSLNLLQLIRHFHVEYNYGEIKYKSELLYTPVSPLKFRFVDRD
jgi:hypothetical protein